MRVHSALNCLRASGWIIEPAEALSGKDGNWSRFVARRGATRLRVREQCRDAAGRVWPDVGAWFWSAWIGTGISPWQVVTVVEGELKPLDKSRP